MTTFAGKRLLAVAGKSNKASHEQQNKLTMGTQSFLLC
jgi:hypothetical protein